MEQNMFNELMKAEQTLDNKSIVQFTREIYLAVYFIDQDTGNIFKRNNKIEIREIKQTKTLVKQYNE